MRSLLATFGDADPQTPFDVAVVIPTVLRPSLGRALASVFAQDLAGTIQVLVGVDRPAGDVDVVKRACAARPAHVTVQVLYPGYSTSAAHGGLHGSRDGGALRCVLSLLANSRHVAYLDDDNWWSPSHLSSLRSVMAGGCEWAYSLRWLIHPDTLAPVAIDRWESVGPDRGEFGRLCGGFVDPNTLMLDKLACAWVLPWWSHPLLGDPNAASADRNVFYALARGHRGAGTGQPTCHYVLNPADTMHPQRLDWLGEAYAAAGGEAAATSAPIRR